MKIDHITILVSSLDRSMPYYEQLLPLVGFSRKSAHGFDVPEVQNLGGASALFMKDPDGLRFEITYYPPGMAAVE